MVGQVGQCRGPYRVGVLGERESNSISWAGYSIAGGAIAL